jgi:hypothetical protein
MRRDFRGLMREGLEEGGAKELVRVWAQAHSDLVLTALEERGTLLRRRYAAYSSVDPTIARRAAARAMVAEALLVLLLALRGLRVLRVLATPVLIGAILVVGWLLVGPLLTIPRISSTGPVVRNGVAAVMVCGEKREFEGMYKAIKYVPEPDTGTWAPVRKGACTVWYHHPPGFEQRLARQERAQREH